MEKEELPVIQWKAQLQRKYGCNVGESALHPKNAQVYWGTAGKLMCFSVHFWSKVGSDCV